MITIKTKDGKKVSFSELQARLPRSTAYWNFTEYLAKKYGVGKEPEQ